MNSSVNTKLRNCETTDTRWEHDSKRGAGFLFERTSQNWRLTRIREVDCTELCWLSTKIAANSTYLFICSCSQYICTWHVQGRFLFSESSVNFLYVVHAAISVILRCINVFLYRKWEKSSHTARRWRRNDNRLNLAPLILTSRLHLTSHFWRISTL